MNCGICGGKIKLNSKIDICHKCRQICPKCGNKKWIYANTCKECSKNGYEEDLQQTATWYLPDEKKQEQIERIRKGLCKFGCGLAAVYPLNAGIPTRCCESANKCPAVCENNASGLKEHWNSLTDEERSRRSFKAGQKIREYRKNLSKEEIDAQWKQRSDNKEWKQKLSVARKKIIESGRAANLKLLGYSKICMKCCEQLKERFPNDELFYEGHGGERIFPGGFRADFLNHTKKFIVEFNGDYWHCNPAKWNAEDYNPVIKMTASDKWAYDLKRHRIFESCGYEVYVIWESNYLISETDCIEMILTEINRKNI